MAAPPPPRRPNEAESSSGESYSDSDDGPPSPARGPPGMFSGPGGPPPIPSRPGMTPGGRNLPPLPGGGARSTRRSKNSKAPSKSGGNADDEYDSYYDYDDYYYEYDDEDGYEYEYEYEYDEEYEYEYEYEDEDGEPIGGGVSIHGMAYKKGTAPMAGMGGMGGMLSAANLMAARGNLNHSDANLEKPKISSGGNRPFGLTSAKLGDLRKGMNPVSRKYEKTQTPKQGSSQLEIPKPSWMDKSLSPTGRQMTVNIQNEPNMAKIKEKLEAAKERKQQRDNQPIFMNGLPVGRTSVRRVRQRVSAKVKKPMPNGRVSAKIALDRKADPNNPNKFLTKNRVSYRVRKPGGEKSRVSKRVSKRVSRKSANGGPNGLERISRRPRDPNRVSRRPAGPRDPNRVSRRGPRDPNRVSRRSKAGPRDPNRVSRRAGPKDPNRVSRRRRPQTSVSRLSANQGIFAAKQKPTDTPGIGKGDGCYLKFEASNGGVLFAQWTATGEPDNAALAFFKPETPVPRFNYKRNNGRVDLMTGTKEDSMKFCEAWTYFFALAKEYNANLSVLGQGREDGLRVDLVSLSDSGEVSPVDVNSEIAINGLKCIAVLPYGSRAFDGVEKVSHSFFIGNANREGHAIKLT